MTKTIAQLSALSTPTSTDLIPIWDTGTLTTYKTTISQLFTNVPNGTVVSPAVSFVNDSTTGVYSPASGKLGISVGGSNKVTISSSGVGIGGDPSYPLDVISVTAIRIPVGNTADKSSFTPAAGNIRFNSETNSFEGYNGTSWVTFTTT